MLRCRPSCPAGRRRPLYIHLHMVTVYSVSADQTITAPYLDHPRPCCCAQGWTLYFSGRVSSECDGRPMSVGCVFLALRASGLPGQCVSTPQQVTAYTVLQNVKTKTKAFQQKVWIVCRILRSMRMLETVCVWNPCYANHTHPWINVIYIPNLSLWALPQTTSLLLQGIWCLQFREGCASCQTSQLNK